MSACSDDQPRDICAHFVLLKAYHYPPLISLFFFFFFSTWASYRKTEPLRWTRYLDECLSVLAEGSETDLDILLAMQIKCQIITNSLTCPHSDGESENESSNGMPPVLMAAMKGRLNDVKQSLPSQTQTASKAIYIMQKP